MAVSTSESEISTRHRDPRRRLGALSNAELARLSDAELLAELAESARGKDALSGREAQLGGEIARREAFRAVGATSLEAYLCGHLGRSGASARVLGHVAERLFDLPALQGALSAGELSFDQVRCVVDVARPDSDAEWVARAKGLSVRDLAELVRRARFDERGRRDDGSDDKADDGSDDKADDGADRQGRRRVRRQGREARRRGRRRAPTGPPRGASARRCAATTPRGP